MNLTLFSIDELPPVNPLAERRRNAHGKPIRFQQPKHGKFHPCDNRCTHAQGQSCSCACQGKNHGIHSL